MFLRDLAEKAKGRMVKLGFGPVKAPVWLMSLGFTNICMYIYIYVYLFLYV